MAFLLDADTILAGIEQWLQLETKWGCPVDLDDVEDQSQQGHTPKTTSSLKKSTFNSSSFENSKKLGTSKSIEYLEFMEDLKMPKRIKPFCLEMSSSVEESYNVFKSLEKLCSATSTVRYPAKRRPSIHDVLQCSISTGGLSFDDTVDSLDVDKYIDKVFDQLHSTLASLSRTVDETSKETVTNLVKRFTAILKSPELNSNPGLRRQCGDKFRNLAAFWQEQAVSGN